MTDDSAQQIDTFTSPGTLLRTAREAQELSEREAADRLNLMPDYVAILERDDYDALRAPAFARGYVKAYGKLLGLNEEELLAAIRAQPDEDGPRHVLYKSWLTHEAHASLALPPFVLDLEQR